MSRCSLSMACGRGGDGGGAAVTRDSAGISIVENTGPAWTAGQEWTVIDSAVIGHRRTTSTA